jgi:uncharacterized GH25 family protein
MKSSIQWAALALAALVPISASAHKTFLLPSTTVLSDAEAASVTFDAAVSNDLFYFNHRPLALQSLVIGTPDGSALAAANVHEGTLRSSFELRLTAAGTYRVSIPTDGLSASYETPAGEKKRARGNAETLAKQIPADAKNVVVTQLQNRVETLGKPDSRALQPTGRGLELVPVTHPNDLFAGEAATFRLVLDGQPASGVAVVVVPGGTRYRNAQDQIDVVTDANGAFSVTWPAPGMYWLHASSEGGKPSEPKAGSRRAAYTATLEVLPQ